MRSKFSVALAAVLLISLLAAPVSSGGKAWVSQAAALPAQAEKQFPPPTEKLELSDASREVQAFNGRYFVLFEGESLVQSFAGDSRAIQMESPEAQSYLNLLRRDQDNRLQQISRVLQRSLQPVFRYDVALNGFALELQPGEAARIRGLPGVRAVIPDRVEQVLTDAGPWFIAADQIWGGETPGGISTKGEGIVVGILDTGINFDHPSFADDQDPDYAYPPTTPKGVCAVSDGPYEGACNNKLIGAYSFTSEAVSPEDTNGHGTHVASIAAGNPSLTSFVLVSGVAPRAQIIAYDVCDEAGLCSITAAVAAIQQAILDEVDIINYSISGGKDPYNDPVELAFLEAFDAGIFVAASAGNLRTEPSADGQVNHVSPWVMTVAASSHDRGNGNWVDVISPTDLIPGELERLRQGLIALPGDGEVFLGGDFEIRSHPDNPSGCQPFEENYFAEFVPSIALLEVSPGCDFYTQISHAKEAGAIGVLAYNPNGLAYPMTGLSTLNIPSAMLDGPEGQALRQFILMMSEENVSVSISISWLVPIRHAYYGDIQAGFSLRGPAFNDFETLKPNVTAPGMNILAAVPGDSDNPDRWGWMSGTSMSSPHMAGAAALIKALHPDWSPAAIQSALMMTAKLDGLRKADAVTPADAFDHGAGRVDLSAAARAGVILDETTASFEAANPANGGDPKTLNLPSLQNNFCVASCTWTRTFRNVSGVAVDMAVVLPGWMTATPSAFTIDIDQTQTVIFTADVSALPLDKWTFATVRLETTNTFSDGKEIADLHLPVAVYRIEVPADIQPPQVESLTVLSGAVPTNQPFVSFLVRFSEDVQGVDAADFATVQGGEVSGSYVHAVSGSGREYTIIVNTGSGSGWLGLKLHPDAAIFDLANNRLTDIPPFDPSAVYRVDKTVPVIQSLLLLDDALTNRAEVRFEIVFSEPVFNLVASDFEAVEQDGLTGSRVRGLEAVGASDRFIVTIETGAPQGRLGLRLKNTSAAHDEAGNPIGGLPYFDSDKTYSIDKVAPQIVAVRRLDENPTSAAQVRFEVEFSEGVQGVDADDFELVESGSLQGSRVVLVMGASNTYQVKLQIGSGTGTIGFLIPANASIQDAVGNCLRNLPLYDPEMTYIISGGVSVYLPLVRK